MTGRRYRRLWALGYGGLLITAGAIAPATAAPPVLQRADFQQESASADVRQLADWVLTSGDQQQMPFLIIDKKAAKVFVFAADGQLRGATAVLLGLSPGDDSAPGIGNQALASIRPEQRVTPAGRFVAALGRNLHGTEILWLDYADALSLHAVITSNPRERRAQRLSSPTPLDNRISYGCINVPALFYQQVISPTFKKTSGVVYVLPETRSAQQQFGSYRVE